jgi:hypothetical protein
MRGISAKEHEQLLDAFRKFELLVSEARVKMNLEDNIKTREGVAELSSSYRHFRFLLSELELCTKEYEKRRKTVQNILYKSIRKMNTEMRKNKSGKKFKNSED